MTRILLAAAVAIVVSAFTLCPVKAAEAPWCAVIGNGTGSVYWDCQYASFDACVPNVLAGNRGFCNENPAYRGRTAPLRKTRRKVRAT